MTVARIASCIVLLAASVAPADERIADLRQGTNIAVAVAPDRGTLVVDLVDQLWRLPIAGGGAEALTPPGDIVRNPRYSPDGRLVVYQRLGGGQWDLWLLDIESLTQRALDPTPYDEREPDFTADGRSVVFVSGQTGHDCLWSIAVDSGVRTQLTEEPGNASFPTVSEHGLVGYVLERDGQWDLRVLTLAGVSITVHTSEHLLGAPSWRPGGDVLVFASQDAAGGDRLQMLLLSDPPLLRTISGAEDLFRGRPAWISAGELVYTADGQIWRRALANPERRPIHLFAALAVEDRPPPTDIGALDAAGPHPVLGINGAQRSADGRRTVFTALGDLWLLERGDPRRLTDDAFVDLDPIFTPDGESVVFASERTGQLELWRLDLRDQRFIQLTFGANRPHRPAPSPDGRRIAFLETDGLGPWAPTRLMLSEPARSADPQTLAVDVVAPGHPAWSADGRTVTLAAAAARPVGVAVPEVRAGPGVASASAGGSAAENAARPQEIELSWQPERPANDAYVVQVGRLFDGLRGDYRRHVDVHVANGRITAIVARGMLPLPAVVKDARDATVIPGLVDVHAHQSSLAGERLGRAWLAYGVTTVREIATDVPAALERGEAWASGRRIGPRLVVTPAAASEPPTSAMLAAAAVPVRRYSGIADGFAHSLARQSRRFGIPAVEQRAGTVLSGSAGSPYELELSPQFAAYQDGLSKLIASATVMTPALAALQGRSAAWTPRGVLRPGQPVLSDPFGALVAPAAREVAALQESVARLVRGGGRVAVGSDAPAVPYGIGVHLELVALAAAGIPNDQVLRIATAEGALALGLELQLGTLEPGKLADFLVVDGDPLARLTDSANITAIVKGGEWIDREQLRDP